MADFRYKARDLNGKAVEGILSAGSSEELAERLDELGLYLIDAGPVKSSSVNISFGGIKRRDIILFTNHLAFSLEAGISLVEAVRDFKEETKPSKFRDIIEDVERQLLSGTGFSEALSHHEKAFTPLYTAVVATGEATGNLDEAMKDLTGFLEWQEELIAQIRQASIYPLFLVSMISGVILLMVTYTLPKFIPLLKGFGQELPTPTKILISVSNAVTGSLVLGIPNWFFLILLVILLWAVKYMTYKKPSGKLFWDKFYLNLPLFGELWKKLILSKFAHYFSMLFSSGISVIESFKIIRDVVDNEIIARAISRCRDSVESGSSIHEAFSKEEIFPSLVQRMIQVGENTGNLNSALEKVSDYYDKEVPASIKKMFALFEPLLIIFMGGVVLFIALAIFLPIYKLTSTIGMQK